MHTKIKGKAIYILLCTEGEVEQVVVYCGRDVVSEDMLEAVAHLASGVLHLHHTHPCSCAILIRKPSGKVIKAVSPNLCLYSINHYSLVSTDRHNLQMDLQIFIL